MTYFEFIQRCLQKDSEQHKLTKTEMTKLQTTIFNAIKGDKK